MFVVSYVCGIVCLYYRMFVVLYVCRILCVYYCVLVVLYFVVLYNFSISCSINLV